MPWYMAKDERIIWVLFRFWTGIEVSSTGCWLWQRARDAGDYAVFSDEYGQVMKVHRWSYQTFCGTIPRNREIDHLCRVRFCVNPTHLEVVTARENQLRGTGFPAINARKTHCLRGHPFIRGNFGWYKINGRWGRVCLLCRRERDRDKKLFYYHMNKQLQSA